MKRLANLFLAALLAFAPIAQADLRASSGAFGPISATSGTISTAVTGVRSVLAASYAAVVTPADTTEDTLATITLPGNTLGANGGVYIRALFSYNNNAGTKTPRVRFGGASGAIYACGTARTTTLVSECHAYVFNANATGAQQGSLGYELTTTGIAVAATAQTSSVDTTSSTTIVITGQKNTGSDTLTLLGFVVEVIH